MKPAQNGKNQSDMADYCMTFIYIEGEKETLQRVADKINLEGGLKSDVFAPMRFEAEDYDFNHCEDARVFDNEGESVFVLFVQLNEEEDTSRWQKSDFPPGVYYELHAMDEVNDWTNDIEGKIVNRPFCVAVMNDAGDEIESRFHTEDEAVQFVKDSNSGVPKDLMTLDAINDFCMSKALEVLWYYRETIINPVCPPRTTKLIECLIKAARNK